MRDVLQWDKHDSGICKTSETDQGQQGVDQLRHERQFGRSQKLDKATETINNHAEKWKFRYYHKFRKLRIA